MGQSFFDKKFQRLPLILQLEYFLISLVVALSGSLGIVAMIPKKVQPQVLGVANRLGFALQPDTMESSNYISNDYNIIIYLSVPLILTLLFYIIWRARKQKYQKKFLSQDQYNDEII